MRSKAELPHSVSACVFLLHTWFNQGKYSSRKLQRNAETGWMCKRALKIFVKVGNLELSNVYEGFDICKLLKTNYYARALLKFDGLNFYHLR